MGGIDENNRFIQSIRIFQRISKNIYNDSCEKKSLPHKTLGKKCRFPLENIPIYHFIFKSRSKNCGVEIVTNALFKASTKVKLCVRGIP